MRAAMKALMSIEGFRSLNQDIETIINKSNAVKKARKEANDEESGSEEKEETVRRRERVQEQTQGDSGETDQIRDSDSDLHVPDRLPRTKPQRCDYPTRAGLIQKGHRSGCEGLRTPRQSRGIQQRTHE